MFPNLRGRGSEAGEKFSPLACAPKCNGGGVGGRRVIFHQQPVPSREWSMVISQYTVESVFACFIIRSYDLRRKIGLFTDCKMFSPAAYPQQAEPHRQVIWLFHFSPLFPLSAHICQNSSRADYIINIWHILQCDQESEKLKKNIIIL